MPASFVISVATAVVTGVFAALVLARTVRRPKPHLLMWGAGLALYSAASLAQSALFAAFSPFLFRLWYWAGGLCVALWLGQGTVFLLVRKGNRAWLSFWMVVLISLVGGLLVFPAPLDPAAYRAGLDLTEQYRAIFAMTPAQASIRAALAIVANSLGTLMLVGGALFSGFLFWRKRVLPHRMWGNVLIAAGGLLPALGGTLILLGDGSLKYVAQLLGGLLLFAGFLVAAQMVPLPGMQPAAAARQAPADEPGRL